ncbi:MAG: site-specific integrase [Fischerella sp. CENA71]|nr:site-specific integrase [Fischerella sp. CENA71]
MVSIKQINRQTILDFLSWGRSGSEGIKCRLQVLRNFFWMGNLQGWFFIEQDIIRNEDFPKQKRGNPNPLTDTITEQIENNLHILPEPIARMWIISFFTAMRPGELAFLKKDCLVQEGENWKVVFERKKTKDWHEVPITRTIAKVIQQQVSYIQQLWTDEWDYLFCHYQGLSKSDPTQPNIIPVRKIIPKKHNTLKLAICCLIKALNIRDDNGRLARFSPNLIRHTRLTQLFEQGHDLAVVSAWAGHKYLATTSIYYTHVSCELIEKEAGHIQKSLFNADGQYLSYENLPSSLRLNPRAHELDLSGDHINTPIYGYCGLPLEQQCDKFRACYTCRCFVAVVEKLPLYIKTRDELRAKHSRAMSQGQDVLVEQFAVQEAQLDKIIASLEKDYEQRKYKDSQN